MKRIGIKIGFVSFLLLWSLSFRTIAQNLESIHCQSYKACFQDIAQGYDLPINDETLFKLAAESTLAWHRLVEGTNQFVLVVKAEFIEDGRSRVRGAQDNGRYYLFRPQAEGFELIHEFDANTYRWASKNKHARIYASLHWSADKAIEEVYDWNGGTFLQTSSVLYQYTAEGTKIPINQKEEGKYMMVLQYSDFGPQAAVYEFLGFEWWQWENHGDSDPQTQYDIKVVVYKDIPLQAVQQMYPVDPKHFQDYRYVQYEHTLIYLDGMIEELGGTILSGMARRFQETKDRVISYFGQERRN